MKLLKDNINPTKPMKSYVLKELDFMTNGIY